MNEEPVSVVVADAKIVGGVAIHERAPSEVKVRRGQVLELKFTYNLEEASAKKELYEFALQSTLDGQSQPVARKQIKDSWGTPQGALGYVSQKYRINEAGSVELRFDASATYTVSKWFGAARRVKDAKNVSGTLTVRVQ
jgi:hypothetical protein